MELLVVSYISFIRRNLISKPILNRTGCCCLFGYVKVKLYCDSILIGYGMLCGSLCKLDLIDIPYIPSSSYLNIVGSKHLGCNENSFMLWHKWIGQISKQRMERLVKDGILQDLDFIDFDTCVDCIKGKLIAKVRNT